MFKTLVSHGWPEWLSLTHTTLQPIVPTPSHWDTIIPIYCTLFYLIPRFQRFASNPENIKPNEPWIFISLSFSLHLSKKWKQDFKIHEICFARFYADITSNFLLLIRNLQYPIIQHKYFSLVYQLWIVTTFSHGHILYHTICCSLYLLNHVSFSKCFLCHFQFMQSNGPELVIESAKVEDTGKYVCMVGNYIGIKSVDVWVMVKQATTSTTTTTTTEPPTTTTTSTTTTTPAPTTTTTSTVASTSTPQPTTTTSTELTYVGPLIIDTTDDEDVYEGNVLFTTIRLFISLLISYIEEFNMLLMSVSWWGSIEILRYVLILKTMNMSKWLVSPNHKFFKYFTLEYSDISWSI